MLTRNPGFAPADRGWGRSKSAAWRMVAGLAVLGTFLFTPTVAEAVFSGSTAHVMSVTTAKLAAPNAAQIVWSATCVRGTQAESVLTITVGSYAKVPGANRHVLTVLSPSGAPHPTKVLAETGQTQYEVRNTSRLMSGTWTYQIHGSYAIPGSSNIWQGPPISRTVICP